jgi:bifunctional non-homologous end joining protein LigD
MGVIKCGRHTIKTSHEDKKLFLPSAITKGQLIDYYYKIAPFMIPYMKNHPVTMVRYPEGIKEEGFYHKDAPEYFPSWIKRVAIKKKEGGSVNYVVCNDQATLVYLANQNCITPHLWLSRIDKLDFPDRMIFDLDPSPGVSFSLVRWTALQLKKLLEALDLTSFVMTTGSHGLHVWVPLNRRADFDTVRDFAQGVAQILVDAYPTKLTLEIRKDKRGKRIFIDYLRNAFSATAVAPYGVRPKPGAPVATPLAWKEVEDPKLTAQKYTITNIFKRLKAKKDPWKTMNKSACSLAQAQKKLKRLLKNN